MTPSSAFYSCIYLPQNCGLWLSNVISWGKNNKKNRMIKLHISKIFQTTVCVIFWYDLILSVFCRKSELSIGRCSSSSKSDAREVLNWFTTILNGPNMYTECMLQYLLLSEYQIVLDDKIFWDTVLVYVRTSLAEAKNNQLSIPDT